DDMAVQSSAEVLLPAEAAEAGFEDPRLFAWRDRLWCCARVGTPANDQESEQVIACLDAGGAGPIRLTLWRVLHPQGRHQQNWIPLVRADPAETGAEGLQFITGYDPTCVVDEDACLILETTPAIAAEQFDGCTPAIGFDACRGQGTSGGWLALIHEAETHDGEQYNQHRWVWFDEASILRRVSPPFFFRQKGSERAAGLAPHPDGKHLLIS